jgi:hypothetical protein
MRTDTDPELLSAEIRNIIAKEVVNDPRSLQRRIGLSEIGTPCTRKLVYALGEIQPASLEGVQWRAAVGRAVHLWLADVFLQWNLREGWDRWFIENRVEIGEIGGKIVGGHSDMYDRLTGTVIDWKIPGPTAMKRVRVHGPSITYIVQAHSYGYGFTLRGVPVRRVLIAFLPSAGEWRDSVIWQQAYDQSIALRAITKADALARTGQAIGFGKLAALATTEDDYCTYCEYFAPRNADPTKGRCEGSAKIINDRAHFSGRKNVPVSDNPLEP